MIVLETERMQLRWLSIDDAPFILELVNEPTWLQFIGDRGVRTLDDARNYIVKGPIEMYGRLGYGLYLVQRKDDLVPMGMCGLLKRSYLEDADIGFAFLPQHVGKGYAYEAAVAVMGYGRCVLGMKRILAITNPENAPSVKLLGKLGLRFERMVTPAGENREVCLFAT